MPQRPQSPCCEPGCHALTRNSRCPTHQSEYRKRSDANRPSAQARGYGARHQRWRKAVLARDYYICRGCRREAGKSAHADHIVPLAKGGGWSLENGQCLCESCHNRKTATEDGGFKGRKAGE